MNKKSAIILLIASIMACLGVKAETITPSNKYLTRKVSTENFTAIRTNTAIDVAYTVGAKNVELYAPDNLIDFIEIKVENGELRIGYKENMNIKGSHNTCLKVSAPDVTQFTAASAGNISINSPIKRKNADVKLRSLSAGNITALDIEGKNVEITANSAGDISVGAIKTDAATLRSNSAGDIKSGDIAATQTVEISANSAGDIDIPEVIAGKSVSANANSAGDITISAINASAVSLSSNSAGYVRAKDVKATSVSANVNSTGKITLAGNCDTAKLGSYSVGDVNARDLKANHVTATARGNGSITCQALQTLEAYRNGRGKIQYAGNPSTVSVNDSAGGVTKL